MTDARSPATTSPGLDQRLERMIDESELLSVVRRYLHGCEQQDWDLVSSCFVPGAPADYGVVGRGTIEDVIAVLSAQMVKLREFFFLGNHFSHIDGDTATSTTSAITVHHPFNGIDTTRNGIWGLRYHDEWTRLDDGWRIAARSCSFDWQGSFRAEGTDGWK